MALSDLFGVILCLAGLVLLANWFNEWYQRRRWEDAAVRSGLEYRRRPGPGDGWAQNVAVFADSVYPSYSHILTGNLDGRPVFVMQHSFHIGKNQYAQTAACFKTRRDLPDFQLSPEGLFDKLAALVGMQDIDFEDDPEFSSRSVLRGASSEKVKALFTPQLRSRLALDEGFTLCGRGKLLVAFRPKIVVAPGRIEEFVRAARRACEPFL